MKLRACAITRWESRIATIKVPQNTPYKHQLDIWISCPVGGGERLSTLTLLFRSDKHYPMKSQQWQQD